jgi:predicted esterase
VLIFVAATILLLGIPAFLTAVFLMLDAETGAGRLFAVSGLLLYAATGCLLWWFERDTRAAGHAAGALGGLALMGFGVCYALSPVGVSAKDAKVQSVFSPGSHYARWSPVNLVPEMDQIKAGADLSPCLDALMTRAKAARMKGLFLTAYREMQLDRDFVEVGSAMGCAYRDLLCMPFRGQHLFSYLPAHPPGQKLPVILFLHGSGGNFKSFLWTWKRFADAHQVAIVAPTFGFGNWSRPGAMEAVDWAYAYCTNHAELDAGRVVLAGLSNGGLGVSRAICRHPDRYRGLVYLSGVMEPDVMASPAFQQSCKGKPILVLHGSQDERIPLAYINQILNGLSGEIVVETKFYPEEDHFLILSKRDEWTKVVFRWMSSLIGEKLPTENNLQK